MREPEQPRLAVARFAPGGTIATQQQQNPPLRLVAGKVTDASFTHAPADGTLAVDTTNKRLYVRVGGGSAQAWVERQSLRVRLPGRRGPSSGWRAAPPAG